MAMTGKQFRDLVWRAGWTFVQAFAGGLVLGPVLDVDPLVAAAIAGGGAVLSLIKSVAGQQLGKDVHG